MSTFPRPLFNLRRTRRADLAGRPFVPTLTAGYGAQGWVKAPSLLAGPRGSGLDAAEQRGQPRVETSTLSAY